MRHDALPWRTILRHSKAAAAAAGGLPPPGNSIGSSIPGGRQMLALRIQRPRFTNSSLSLINKEKLSSTLDLLEQGSGQVGYMTFANLLQACSNSRVLSQAKRVHAQLVRRGLDLDRYLSNLLIGMYGKCGSARDARKVFETMRRRNVVSWNTMITVYAENGRGREALKLFREMEMADLRPNKITFVTCLNACVSPETLAEGEYIHKLVVERGFALDPIVGTAIAKMYGKCGSLEEARRVFDTLPRRNVISWNTLIAAYAEHGRVGEVTKLVDEMQLDGVRPDKVTFISALNAFSGSEVLAEAQKLHATIVINAFDKDTSVGNALLNTYWKCGSIVKVESVFSEMPKRDIISWNSIISANCDDRVRALNLFGSLQWSGMDPDTITLVNTLSACCSPAALDDGRSIHDSIIKSGFDISLILGNALVSMYGKCGSSEDAYLVFSKMPDRDLISWNGMIGAYARNGYGKEALQLFQQMESESIIPDKVTFIIIIDSCAGMEALTKGREIHKKIIDRKIEKDVMVGTALINMYNESGSLEEARQAFDRISGRNIATWNAMIGSYAHHGHGKEAVQLFREMQSQQVKPDKVTFVGLLSACSHAGLISEGRYFFHSLRKDFGLSLSLEHYGCMVDLLGRAGELEEAEELLLTMPLPPNHVLWLTLLGACKKHGDVERGKRAAKHVLELDPNNNAAKLMLLYLHATAERLGGAADERGRFLSQGLRPPIAVG